MTLDGVRVNPLEGQVAIPSPVAVGGYVVGSLGARAMVWVEQSTGKPIDDIYHDIFRRMSAVANGDDADPAVFPVAVAGAVLWAAVEHERRRSRAPGPEYTIDDAYELIEHVGLDECYSYVLTLLQVSLPFKKRAKALEDAAAAAGEPSPMDPLRAAATAAATAGTGTGTSTTPSTPASTLPPPGS